MEDRDVTRRVSPGCISALLLGFLVGGCGGDDDEAVGDIGPATLFTDITDESRLDFVHDAAVTGDYWFPEISGPGAALFDYDGDGDLDIYLVNGAYRSESPETPTLRNQLYRQAADHTFENVTDVSGLGDTGYGMGVAVGDYDNDGDLDVYVTNVGPDALYRNDGDGSFTNVSRAAGITNPDWGTSVAFIDLDLDGRLDVYVATYAIIDTTLKCVDPAGRRVYCAPYKYQGLPDVIYHNNGDGTFTDISESSGITADSGKGLGVIGVDLTDDGFPDIYVANDGNPNNLWVNGRSGSFRDEAQQLGLAVNAAGLAEASMGIAVGDVFNIGKLDLFLTHLTAESNTFYRSAPFGFEDASVAVGLGGPSLPVTSFGTGFIDYDHDGDLDVVIVNGRVNPGPALIDRDPPEYWDRYAEPNMIFENTGDGRFRNVSESAPDFSGDIAPSRALVFGDIDGDGDLDMLVTNLGGRARLYRNDAAQGNWLIVRAVDRALRRDATGASVTVVADGNEYRRLVLAAYSYLSSNDPRAHFGLGTATAVDEIRVIWPGGTAERFAGVPVNQVVTVEKGRGSRIDG